MISNAHRHQNGGHDPPKMLGDVQNLPGYRDTPKTGRLSSVGWDLTSPKCRHTPNGSKRFDIQHLRVATREAIAGRDDAPESPDLIFKHPTEVPTVRFQGGKHQKREDEAAITEMLTPYILYVPNSLKNTWSCPAHFLCRASKTLRREEICAPWRGCCRSTTCTVCQRRA